MTRVYSNHEITKGCFSFRVAFYEKDSFYGTLEILYTATDIHSVDYSQRFIARTLPPHQLAVELSSAITKVCRLRSGYTDEDLLLNFEDSE